MVLIGFGKKEQNKYKILAIEIGDRLICVSSECAMYPDPDAQE